MSMNSSEQLVPPEGEVIILPPRLDSSEADNLKEMILNKKKTYKNVEIILDASQVTYLGGLCLQIILASRYPIKNVSQNLKQTFNRFGFDASLNPLT